jgi:hypothetical protein
MKTMFTGKTQVMMPETDDVTNLKVGDEAPSFSGIMRKVARITSCGTTHTGQRYVCYYTEISPSCCVSMSMVAQRLVRDLNTTRFHTSAELDVFERMMQKQ